MLHLVQEVDWVLLKKLMLINVFAVLDLLAGFVRRVSESIHSGPVARKVDSDIYNV